MYIYMYIYIYIHIHNIYYIYIYIHKNLTVYENRSGSSNLLSNTVKKYISVCLFKILI